jgi:hypothetical protein
LGNADPNQCEIPSHTNKNYGYPKDKKIIDNGRCGERGALMHCF